MCGLWLLMVQVHNSLLSLGKKGVDIARLHVILNLELQRKKTMTVFFVVTMLNVKKRQLM